MVIEDSPGYVFFTRETLCSPANSHKTQQRLTQFTQEGALATLAVTTWITGWAASQALLLEWLPTCPDWLIVYARVRLVALFRKVREQGGLVTLAEILRTVADRTSWKPWSEAVSALASGDGPRGCTSAEARRIYDELS